MTTTNISSTKVDIEAEYKALLTGLDSILPNETSFDLVGQTYARADLFARIQARIDAAEATKTAKTQWHNKVAAERAAEAIANPIRAALKSYLEAKYGKTSPMLQQFGFAQAKTPKTSAPVKARAVLKGADTRKLLHTMGKNQKKVAIEAAATAVAPPAAEQLGPAPVTAAPVKGTTGNG